MKFSFVIFGLCLLIAASATSAEEQKTSVWDMIPVISQGKSLIQLIFGDSEGAATTQKNFLDEGFVSAQVRSVYFLATGDPKKALEIQTKSISNLEEIVDGLPLLGHIKGGIHLLVGDNDHGWDALKSATSTSGSVIGAFLGGPLGAMGGHLLTDAIISGTDVLINGNRSELHGLINYAANVEDLKPGDHFDVLAGLVLDAGAGRKKMTKKRGWLNIDQFGNKKSAAESYELQPLLENKNRKSYYKSVGMADNMGVVTDVPVLRSNEMGTSILNRFMMSLLNEDFPNYLKFVNFLNFLRYDATYKAFELYKAWHGETTPESIVRMNFDGLERYQYNSNLDSLDVNLLTDKLKYLTADERSLIDKHDFRTINTERMTKNCLACTLAAMTKQNLKTVERQIAENLKPGGNSHNTNLALDALVKSKVIAKFKSSKELVGVKALNTYLKDNAPTLENKPLMLETMYYKGNGEPPFIIDGHGTMLKFKMVKDISDPVKLLIDYQYPGFVKPDIPNPYRFQQFLNTDVYKYFYVTDMELVKQ